MGSIASALETNIDTVWIGLKADVNALSAGLISNLNHKFGHPNESAIPKAPVSLTGAAIIPALDKTPGTKKSSAAFTNLDMAVAACPNQISKCGISGSRKIAASSTATTVNAVNLSSNDSCHYLVVADCDLPEIKITANTMGANWNLDFIEWQDTTGTTMQTATEGNVDYPAMTTVPRWYSGYESGTATLPFLKNSVIKKGFPAAGTDTTFKYDFPISKLVDDVAAYDAIVLQYSTDVTDYNTAKTKYNAQVTANKDKYEEAKEEFDARNAFSCFFGCEDFEYPEITLDAPTIPARPAAYAGKALADLESDWGLGNMIAGKLDMTAAKIKAFGVLGQASATG